MNTVLLHLLPSPWNVRTFKESMIFSCMWIFSFSWRLTTQLAAYSLTDILTFMLKSMYQHQPLVDISHSTSIIHGFLEPNAPNLAGMLECNSRQKMWCIACINMYHPQFLNTYGILFSLVIHTRQRQPQPLNNTLWFYPKKILGCERRPLHAQQQGNYMPTQAINNMNNLCCPVTRNAQATRNMKVYLWFVYHCFQQLRLTWGIKWLVNYELERMGKEPVST